ncbi:cre-bre-3 protein [Colletotrichum karsti]|uniref:Cre-bre-3 protein n=1 Tax=Colletotrichum karsti TaxID=1095194 RepID=A0A9P6I6Z1_9PEZI|nr:cre-bre-3 protein [Colletotrichum karsti]KAF9878423.1 cre-bre-3 protein [Colletotrichum karsti]
MSEKELDAKRHFLRGGIPRTRKDLYTTITKYNSYIFPFTLAATFFTLWKLAHVTHHYGNAVSPNNHWNWATIFQTALLAVGLIAQMPPYVSVIGLCMPMRPAANAQAPVKRDFRSLRVCLVTKGTNFDTVMRATRAWAQLQNIPGVRFHVVLDDEKREVQFRQALPSFVQIIVVPSAFTPNKAKYKARALEFYRRNQQLSSRDWVLHLDEESMIDADVMDSCIDFITRSDLDVAMGTLHYNDVNHWKNGFLTTAETLRSQEDFGKFSFSVRTRNKPMLGWMHGSWIVINGAVENAVTWDTDCQAEDFWFAYNSSAKGYRFGWIWNTVHEQPNETFHDFWKQRRRWYTGILSIPSIVVQISLVLGVIGEFVYWIGPVYTSLGGAFIIPKWLYIWGLWHLSVDTHSLMVASFMQDLTAPAGVTWLQTVQHALQTIILAPFVRLVQVAALLTCVFKPAKGFDIVSKI